MMPLHIVKEEYILWLFPLENVEHSLSVWCNDIMPAVYTQTIMYVAYAISLGKVSSTKKITPIDFNNYN